jgi:hypothetical protein
VIVGHVGVAAATRSVWQRASLPWLLVGCALPDLVDVGFALAGVCNPYGLYSHTVHAAALQAAVLGGAALLVTGSRPTALASALMVLLHLPPDLITGYKIFWPGGPMMGLYVYEHPLLDFLIEAPILIVGWWLLRRTGGAPRWATSVLVLGALLAGQGALDILTRNGGAKPSACSSPSRLPWSVTSVRAMFELAPRTRDNASTAV